MTEKLTLVLPDVHDKTVARNWYVYTDDHEEGEVVFGFDFDCQYVCYRNVGPFLEAFIRTRNVVSARKMRRLLPDFSINISNAPLEKLTEMQIAGDFTERGERPEYDIRKRSEKGSQAAKRKWHEIDDLKNEIISLNARIKKYEQEENLKIVGTL